MKKNVVKINEDTLKQIIAESITNYFKQDGDYYGNDPTINDKKGWFVYLLKDSMTGELTAEITKANLKNAGMHINSLNGLPKKVFAKYEDAVKWCQSKGVEKITPRDENGHLRIDAPKSYGHDNNEPYQNNDYTEDSSYYLQESKIRNIVREEIEKALN